MKRTGTIDVDGVPFHLRYFLVDKGSSFFIPCHKHKDVLKQVRAEFTRRGWKLVHRVRIENNLLGIRIWRTL